MSIIANSTVRLAPIPQPISPPSDLKTVVAFFIANIAIGYAMTRIGGLASIHSLFIVLLGLYWATTHGAPERVAYIGAYIAGTEVLWRMSGGYILWEFAKYAASLVFAVALLKRRFSGSTIIPFLYLLLLLPATIPPIAALGVLGARSDISFNLSGPLALCISAAFFSGLNLNRSQLANLLLAYIGPALGISMKILFSMASSDLIIFTGGSNFVTSGGFGPNQVSATLGLAGLLSVFSAIIRSENFPLRILFGGLALLFFAQSVLTFSRSGIYFAGAAFITAALFSLKNARMRWRFIGIGGLLVVGIILVIPKLDEYTDGMLKARFESLDTTGREFIAKNELEAWSENPLWGVGLGQSAIQDKYNQTITSSHTEFTRLLAEHGMLGLFALLAMLAMALRNFLSARSNSQRGFSAGLIVWSFVFMLGSAMRLYAPSFMFGLAGISLEEEAHTQARPSEPPVRPGPRRRTRRAVASYSARPEGSQP